MVKINPYQPLKSYRNDKKYLMEKGKFFQVYHPKASYITVSDINLLFQFLFFSLQEICRSSVCHFNVKP